MTEPIHPNPVATPWSPNTGGQNPPPQTPAPSGIAPGQGQGQGQNGYAQPYQGETYQAPPNAAYQSAPQAPVPYGQSPMGQPLQQAFESAPVQNGQGHNTYNGHSVYDQNAPVQPHQQPHPHQQPQPQQPYQHSRTAYMPAHQGPGGMMAPPHAPEMQQGADALGGPAMMPKSLLGRLLQRSPRPDRLDQDLRDGPQVSKIQSRLSPQVQFQNPSQYQDPSQPHPQYSAPQTAGAAQSQLQTHASPQVKTSLFNKNFALGAVAGIIVGAFVLPMLISMVSGDGSQQTQAQFQTTPSGDSYASDAAYNTEETFLDAAIAADE